MPFKATYTEAQLIDAVKNSRYLTEALRHLNLTDGSRKSLKNKIQKMKLDTSHWEDPYTLLISNLKNIQPKSLGEILVEDSGYTYTTQLKERLIKAKLLENKCARCGQMPFWFDQELKLQLDHINGIYNDNRIENLRILCPNCHSQTETFCGKKDKRKDLPKCETCENQVRDRRSKRCKECYLKDDSRKKEIVWPEDKELIKMINNSSYRAVAQSLGVHDTTIHTRLKRKNLKHEIKRTNSNVY